MQIPPPKGVGGGNDFFIWGLQPIFIREGNKYAFRYKQMGSGRHTTLNHCVDAITLPGCLPGKPTFPTGTRWF